MGLRRCWRYDRQVAVSPLEMTLPDCNRLAFLLRIACLVYRSQKSNSSSRRVKMMNALLAIQMNIFTALLLLCIVLHAYFRLNKKEAVNKLFLTLLSLSFCVLVLEIFSVLLNNAGYVQWITLHKTVDMTGFLVTPLVPIAAILYSYKRINPCKNPPADMLKWLAIPCCINGVLAVASYFWPVLFYIADDNAYTRGPLFFMSPLISYFSYFFHLAFLYSNKKRLSKEEGVSLASLSALPALLSVLQLHYFVYLTIWNSIALALVVNYIFIMYSQAKYDRLTGLGNRIIYEECLAGFCGESHVLLSVINIDLDDFKQINDSFGHQEGDRALKFFAEQLKTVFAENGEAIRLGGDEFIVLLRERRSDKLEAYMQNLKDRVENFNRHNEMAYSLQFSYGIAIFDRSYGDIYDFIRHSDRLMYEAKQRKRFQPE